MLIPNWVTLALVIPVLWLGETAVRRTRWLSRFSIPAPRAFLVVPAVGSFLVDLANAFAITGFFKLMR